MTEKEVLKQIKGNIKQCCALISCEWEKDEEALDMVIKMLEKRCINNAIKAVEEKYFVNKES